jgi:hypothetical protein
MLANSKAQTMILEILGESLPKLSEKILEIIEGGIIEIDGIYIFAKFAKDFTETEYVVSAKNSEYRSDSIDETGIECSENHIHLDSYQGEQSGLESMKCMLLLSKLILKEMEKFDTKFRIIFSIGSEMDVVIRFHALRNGQTWISDNLEGFQEAIVVIDS